MDSDEPRSKRALALEIAQRSGSDALITSEPPSVRWLLCGRGRPVDVAAPESPYTVVVTDEGGYVLFADIETSRVSAEERFEELGYRPLPYPWFEGRDAVLDDLLGGRGHVGDRVIGGALAAARRRLVEPELERYRAAGADAAAAMEAAVRGARSDQREIDVAADIAFQCAERGLFAGVVLVAGELRQGLHRHPLPTDDTLGRHALLALTAEREGLYVSLTRLLSFGSPPAELGELVGAAARVDAAVLRASRPGAKLEALFELIRGAYADAGHPGEWRSHHQGGIAGYRGREVFAVPGDPTALPEACAVAWNPSIAGGAKSEDTALVTADGIDIITRTPDLGEIDVDGLPRPAIVEL